MEYCEWHVLVLPGLTFSVCGALPVSERPPTRQTDCPADNATGTTGSP